jgi:hypothetical protein
VDGDTISMSAYEEQDHPEAQIKRTMAWQDVVQMLLYFTYEQLMRS